MGRTRGHPSLLKDVREVHTPLLYIRIQDGKVRHMDGVFMQGHRIEQRDRPAHHAQ